MSDIDSTILRYEAVCTELSQQKHPYIMKMLEKERDEALLRKKKSEFKENMHLYLAGNNKLLTDVRLADTEMVSLYKLLTNNTYVTSLDLRYNNITDEGATYIAKLIEETASLHELNIMCNDIGPKGGEIIARALQQNHTVRSLRINGNKIGSRGGMGFAQMLQVNSTLEALDIGDTDLTIETVIAICTVLYRNTSLKVLNINRPILFTHQEETTVHFAKMLKVNTTLTELHLQKYDMRDFGATRLSDNLIHNMTLTYLDLSCNRITRDGAKEIAKVLKTNTGIKVLDLGFNRLEDDGAVHLAEAIGTYNTHLEKLVVRSNNIGSKGLCALADSMKVNSTLSGIFIWGNNLEEPVCIAFAGLLQSKRLDPLNTDVKPFVVDGETKLSETSHQIQRHYYWAPYYGDDVPAWQVRGKNPRGSDVTVVRDLMVY